jgi:hypothetical protein
MAWSRKDARDDLNHPKPVKLPPNGWDKPEKRAADRAMEAVNQASYEPPEEHMNEPPASPVNMALFVQDMNRDRIADIKEIVRKLTYGEMMEVAALMAEAMPSGTVDKDAFKFILPPTLHAFASKAA